MAAAAGCLQAAAQEPSLPLRPASPHRTLLNRYCVTCHNEKLQTAGLMLDRMDPENVREVAPVWEKVVRKLRTGAMPPAAVPRPDKASADSFAAYLEAELDRAAIAKPNPGRPVVHRLNRTEYSNAVRDLLAVDTDAIDVRSLLPPDDSSRGFDNNADILSVSPLLIERYMSAARKITQVAIGDPDMRSYTSSYDVPRRLVQDDRMSEDLPFGSRGGIAIRHHFPLDGEYVIRVRLQRNNDNYIRGLGEPHQLDIRLDGARLELFTIGGAHKGRSGPIYSFIHKDYKGDAEQENYEFTADAGLEVRFQAKAGSRVVGVAFLEQPSEPEGELMPRQLFDELLSFKGGEPAVDNVSIAGPYDARGPGEMLSRRRVFVCWPADGAKRGDAKQVANKLEDSNDSGEEPCAGRILSALARRAYRRPAKEEDIRTLLKFYAVGYKQAGFEAGIRMAVQGVLVSPEFLFRIEHDPDSLAPGTPYPVSDLELASRLSFFLWSSIPDDQLLDLAESARLRNPEVLEQQVKRMLADSRANALVDNFTVQWLGLRKVEMVSPDPRVFPDFDGNLRDALLQETKLFAESIARENRSVLDFLRADYTFLNERLAAHYGIPKVYGSGFRRVTLSDENRRGLLGQGSVLTATSYANRTAPTLRGKWVLDNILGTPPPPPPPDVPSLKEEDARNGRALTMRERMDLHRVSPACAACHARMDPLGFALENFDAIGRWRVTEAEKPIDPSGGLPDGTKFHGPAELREILLQRNEQFVMTFTEKLLMYALGRGLEYYDQPVVRRIIREAAPSDHRWSSLVLGIAKSAPFQMRRTREP